MRDAAFEQVLALCQDVAKRSKPQMKWMWGEGLFGYALDELDCFLGTQHFTPFLTAYCDYWAANPPTIDYADRAAPALITYAMQKKTGNPAYAALTNQALAYIRQTPRLAGDVVNHLGQSLESRWYPASIWVDSLMMFGVFPARYAAETGDDQLLDFAARQPQAYSRYLQDSGTGLWYHSYWVKAARHHPKADLFWGRGNGWVICSLPMILDQIGPTHPEFAGILALLRQTAQALPTLQNPDGSFNTLLNQPSYRELSATALIAAGLLHGVCQGYLSQRYLPVGQRAFHAVAASICQGPKGMYLPQISAPTIPLQLFPGLCYRLTPRGDNWSYGLAAAAFAAIWYAKTTP